MNRQQATAALAYAAALDPRVRRNDPRECELQIDAWHAILDRTDLPAAINAIRAHYAQPAAPAVMPGDIRQTAADRHPSARPAREVIAELEHHEPPVGPTITAADARARIAQIVDRIAAKRALPDSAADQKAAI